MTNAKTIKLTVTTSTMGTREMVVRDQRGYSAEKQAAYWTKLWKSEGHTVVRG